MHLLYVIRQRQIYENMFTMRCIIKIICVIGEIKTKCVCRNSFVLRLHWLTLHFSLLEIGWKRGRQRILFRSFQKIINCANDNGEIRRPIP